MCGRINLWMSSAELAEVFELFREPEWSPRYNLCPMQQILTVRMHPKGVRLAEPTQWGLVPSWTKGHSTGPPLNNSRSDTISIRPAFREAFRRQRCLIPANGFYEWKHLDKKTTQPWHIFRKNRQPLALAGLWDHWQTPDGDTLESCSVITTDANRMMSLVHDRMPVILDHERWVEWLSPENEDIESLAKLLVPCPDDWLERTPVSSVVNNVRHDSPECIRVVSETRTLF